MPAIQWNTVEQIFPYIDFIQLQKMRLASSQLNRSIMGQFKTIVLFQTTDNLTHLFSDCTSLECLQIIGISKQSDVKRICKALADGALQDLLTLDLQYSRITDRNIVLLFNTLQSGCCRHLTAIYLCNNAMSVAGSSAMAACLSQGVFSDIRIIDLHHNLIFAGGIQKISQAFMNFHSRNLKEINISRCHLANPGIRFFCQSINGCPLITLRSLRLYWNSITSGGIKHLALTLSLGILDSLEVLDISKNPIGAKGARMLTESIMRGNHLPRLQVLLMHTCRLKKGGMRWVGIMLRYLKGLRVLSLGNNSIEAKGVCHLFEGIKHETFYLQHLQILDLTNNRIKTEGVEYLTEMIQNNNFPRLEELSLISNNIKDEGLMKLISVMKYGFLPHLRTIYLSDNKLHDESVKQLSTVLADRKIAGNAELYLGCNSLSSAMIQNLVSLLYIAPPLKGEPPLKYVVLEKKQKEIPEHLLKNALALSASFSLC